MKRKASRQNAVIQSQVIESKPTRINMKKIKLTQQILMGKGEIMMVTDQYADHLQWLNVAELVPDKKPVKNRGGKRTEQKVNDR